VGPLWIGIAGLALVAEPTAVSLTTDLECRPALEARLARAGLTTRAEGARIAVELFAAPDGGAVLRLSDAGEISERQIPAASCAVVAEAAAWIVATWIDALPWRERLPASPAPAIGPPISAPAQVVEDPVVPAAITPTLAPPNEAPSSPRLAARPPTPSAPPVERPVAITQARGWKVAALGGVGSGPAASALVGAAVESEAFDGWAFAARVHGASGARIRASTGQLTVERYSAFATVRRGLLQLDRAELALRAGVGIEWTRASASGFTTNGQASFVEPVAVVAPALEWRLGGPITLFAEAGAMLAPRRNGLIITNLGEVGAIPHLTLWGAAGAAVFFF
jgi:hypothetical protein